MGMTAIILLFVARLWLWLDDVLILDVRFSPLAIALGIGIGIGITGASSIVYRLWPAYQRSADMYLKLVLKPLMLPDLVWLGVLPGLSEELLFRGVMIPALGFNAMAVVVSSLCFGVLHFSGSQQWPYVIWATMIGGVLGFSALATGNLLVPIVAHITTNMVSSYMWKMDR
jgi:membrane protease YdiL (CAAX protease family)